MTAPRPTRWFCLCAVPEELVALSEEEEEEELWTWTSATPTNRMNREPHLRPFSFLLRMMTEKRAVVRIFSW